MLFGSGWWKDDGIYFTGGYQNRLFRIQYAYDHTTRNLGQIGGAHEIILGFNFWKRPAHKNFIETH